MEDQVFISFQLLLDCLQKNIHWDVRVQYRTIKFEREATSTVEETDYITEDEDKENHIERITAYSSLISVEA